MANTNKQIHEQRGTARVQTAVRNQVEIAMLTLDERLDKGHRVRIVWQYVESFDLSELYDEIRARVGEVGRDAVDPRILFGLWLFATIEGCTSARQLERLAERDIAYLWLCGGVTVNYHLLSDFRNEHTTLLEKIMTESIAVLLHQQLIDLDTVAQDGMKVRANAGEGSFRREQTLEECLKKAEAHLAAIKEVNTETAEQRAKANSERAAQEKVTKVRKAIEAIEVLKSKRAVANKKRDATREIRASTTDPEARRMKMGDGGYRPAYNVQFGTDGKTRLIVGVDVVNQGSDQGLMALMHRKIVQDYDQLPANYLVDGGFTKSADITELAEKGTKVFGVIPNAKNQLKAGKDPYAKKPDDSKGMAEFRERMGTQDAKERYATRASIAEFPNAECRNRGLLQFRTRGIIKAKAQVMWHVLAHNFNRFMHLDYLRLFIGQPIPLGC